MTPILIRLRDSAAVVLVSAALLFAAVAVFSVAGEVFR